jgi:CubicO group peptidase (beta-lactamase class C family)
LWLSSGTRADVEALVEETIRENGVVGYAIAILQDGELVYTTRGGFANIEHRVPISETSRFQIYSASKLFFNVALMQLVEAGQLNPEATLGTYLDGLPPAWAELTVSQTWSHMTGTTDILDLRGMEPTEEEALASVIDIPLRFEPGTETEYNQTNFLLLKMVFEAISGRPYREVLEEVLLAPVGINDLPLGDLNLVADNLTTNYEAHPYEPGRLGRRSISFPSYVYTSAGLNITLDELTRWWQAFLQGSFVSQETIDRFWEPVTRADGSNSYRAHGWERVQQEERLRIGHGGGARIHLFHYIPNGEPERSATVIFLNNGGAAFFDHRKFGDEVASLVLASPT